ncbi:vanadium-dependent haloperoxidase [Algoriphagus halophytocola]|uniref:Vanadium-dependent haloperoxidase n=1 Tax=Algoriphagus halophytocola TaxID=2991499 RepID=A0ABY6MJT7_9BACT|nr:MULTISPECIES: vanadium-dependent haloperoxidase [unclassified Algoriphagus]UZD24050.1 vanadium-dependent haloperoxidase [Algoriphagus sp. TR-M5]WBL41422.1 vanadium-dependent haloperoxidase [Algoriphagus sp. TR-M9]
MKKHLFGFFTIFLLTQRAIAVEEKVDWPKLYAEQLFHITEVMVTDVASPPVAARIYAYTTLASYIITKECTGDFSNKEILTETYLQNYDWSITHSPLSSPEFSAILAMLKVGQAIMPSGYLLEATQKEWIDQALKDKLVRKKNLTEHVELASQVAEKVMEIAKKDGYLQLSTLTRYTPQKGEGFWYPTPPAYISAVEPEWKTIKPFFIKDLKEYDPAPMAPFDMSEGSSFHTQLIEVYQTTNELSDERKLIANFWDCNPFKVEFSGHMAIGVKKISPGGHWIGITGIAAQKAKLSFAETAYIHALVGMTLHDAFISCWKVKYDTDRIRPETVINQKIDQRWRPLLQTPPFPEYTSGHSVISRASAVILTGYFGDDFEFVDSSETYFGLPERPFPSFLYASEEAAISRLYGGIHFRDAIEEGVKQGEKIGDMIWTQVAQANN